MDSELDRTHTPFDDHPEANAEFESWPDDVMQPSPEMIAAEEAYWENWHRRLENRLDLEREEGKRF